VVIRNEQDRELAVGCFISFILNALHMELYQMDTPGTKL
jgi:hypothetical protein